MDNGKPGQIVVTVFYDENANGIKDQGEKGLIDQVSISQDSTCPPSNLQNITRSDTASNGETVFNELKPGRYCISYMGGRASTTKLNSEVFLSSEQKAQVFFGLSEQ